MKVSKREKYLLSILATVLIGVVYYEFIYSKQVEKLNVKKVEKTVIETRYNEVTKSIKTLEIRKENLKTLNATILEKSSIFYPTILQEKIILEIDKLLSDSELKGNIAFTPIEICSVEMMVSNEIEKPESSMQSIVDRYNNKLDKEDVDINQIENIIEEDNAAEGNGVDSVSEEELVTSEQLKVAINFTGSYDSLKKFILSVEEYDRKVVITNISITPKSNKEVTGTMNMEFYAVPKLGNDDEYLKWNVENVYGKDSIFSTGAANGAYNSTVEQQEAELNINDFVMMLRSSSSELPTLTIGKAKDSARETYLYSDNDKVEEVEIKFKEDAEKLYYEYKTTKDFYPKNNTGAGKEFTPISDDIVMEITSEIRSLSNDNSTVKLKVINNTNKKINIIIRGDDNSNPRVSILSEGNTVNVTKK